ncbi:hypothetical protein N665_0027s0056 [Sinapis alba]|nr:hypothetical protein N665_0027s0056 [Sinapis alba]
MEDIKKAKEAKEGTSKRDRENQSSEVQGPPASRKRVNGIMGVNPLCDASIRALKGYSRQVNFISTKAKEMIEDDTVIKFKEHKMTNLDWPHNYILVIKIILADCKINRSLIDTGTPVNMIYKHTLDQMELTDPEIRPSRHAITSLNGFSQNPIETIRLLTYVGGIMLDTKFTIIDSPDMYNIILITSYIHVMRAVPSTFHQCIKFPTAGGVTSYNI